MSTKFVCVVAEVDVDVEKVVLVNAVLSRIVVSRRLGCWLLG
jgi:hypothetical protein